jgi:hypothetical protein
MGLVGVGCGGVTGRSATSAGVAGAGSGGASAGGATGDVGAGDGTAGGAGDGAAGGDATATAVVLAGNQDQPGALALDDGYVYFAVYGDAANHGAIRRVAKGGGAVTTLADGEFVPGSLVVDATRVYWTSNDPDHSSSGAIRAVDKAGGTPISLASGLSSARALTADDAALYFATEKAIVALSKSGGVSWPLAAATCVNATASDSTTIYWTENCVFFPPQGIFAVSKLGGVPVVVSTDAPGTLGADGAFVYWVADGVVEAQPRFGGLPLPLYSTGDYGVFGAFDATALYLEVGETIARVPKIGGSATTIWKGDFAPNAIAADATRVYFDGGYPSGAVYSLRR